MNFSLSHLPLLFLPPKVEGGIFHNVVGRLPALFPALGVLSVLLPEQLFPREAFGLLPGWITAFLLLPMIFLFYHEKKAVLLFALGAFLSFLSFENGGKEKELEKYLASPLPVGVEMKLIIQDPALVPELLPNPRTLLTEVKAIRYPGEKEYQKLAKGNFLMLFLPARFSRVDFGEEYFFKGSISKGGTPLFPGAFSYGEYLAQKGIAGVARPYTLKKLGEKKDFSSLLYDIRSSCMKKVLAHIHAPEFRAMACAILFGCKQGISHETKEEMIHSGLIHILTVSGLHIGLFAALAGLVFLWVPCRLRYILIIFASFFYALATGFGLPAVRALLMISFYALGRAFFLNSSPFNALSFAFFLLLLFRKEELTQAGFLYTFSATAILLLAGDFFHKRIIFFREKGFWMADPSAPKLEKKPPFMEKFFDSLFACLAAWMVTGILTLHFQGVYAPLSPLANLILLPIIWLFYPIFLLGSLLGIIWEGAGVISGGILEYLCAFLKLVSSYVSKNSFLLPPLGGVPAFLMLLILFLPFLLLRRKLEVLLFLTLPSFLLFTFFLFAPWGHGKGELTLIEGGGSGEKAPILLYSNRKEDLAFAVNPSGAFPLPLEIAEYFKRQGHRKLRFILATGTRKEDLEGIAYFLRKIPTQRLYLPRPAKNSPGAEELIKAAEQAKTKITFIEGKRGKSYLYKLHFQFRGEEFSFISKENSLTLQSCKKELLHKTRDREMLPIRRAFSLHFQEGKEKNPSAFLEVILPHSSCVIPLHSAIFSAI